MTIRKWSILTLALCFTISAAAADRIVEMPNGRKLKNPYILDYDAAYVSIGHDEGGLTIPIRDLPAEFQKKLNYDPKKAAELEKKREAEKAARTAAKTKKPKKPSSAEQKKKIQAKIDALEKQIRDLSIQIAADEKNLDKIEKLVDDNRSNSVTLASIQSDSGGYYSWGYGGFRSSSGRAASRDSRNRREQIKRMNKEDDKAFSTYKAKSKKITQDKMKLEQAKADLKRLRTKYPDML